MLKSYFKIAFRNLLKQKGFSIIKIAGLALGLAASLIIYLYVLEDMSYDKFHPEHDRIVRLLTIDNAEGVSSKLVGVTQPRLGPAAKDELPEVVESVRFTGGGQYDLAYEDKTLKCKAAFRVDPTVFSVFNFPVVNGPSSGILDQPGSIAITTSLAEKIFGKENPVGKTLRLNQTTDLHVTAVLADPPKNSHIQFDLLHSLVPGQNEDGFRQALDTWQSIFTYTYLLLDKPANIENLNEKLQAITAKNNSFDFFHPVAQPLDDVHLKSKGILFEVNANKSDMQNVYILSIISALILFLALVNFTNLVTANAAGRAKEIGMRKVIGAVRGQLIAQHLSESILITVVAMVLALGTAWTFLPALNNLYNRFGDFSILLQPENVILISIITVCIGALAGIYPSLVLSGFKPVQVLKGTFKGSNNGIRLRKALVVVQFTISIALMVGTGIVYQQMDFIYNADLGYNREQVITIQQNGATAGRSVTLKNELLKNANIVSVGTSSSRIGQQPGRATIYPEGRSITDTNIIASIMTSDENFVPTMDIRMKSGRSFSLQYDDSLSMVINEEMEKLLGWEDAVGRRISLPSGPEPTDLTAYTVIGVVRNFHFATIRHKIEPMFMLYNDNNNAMSIRIKESGIDETINYITDTWKKVNPGTTFEYAFLDEQFANLYRNEEAFRAMFTHFTVLALIIAGLGLFALSAYSAEQRKKEIGIRKVLGASTLSILFRLSGEFLVLILTSFAIASVIAYFAMDKWLQDFQYSIRISAGIFIVAGIGAVLIALLTISFQALKAALHNPVKSLRSE